MLKTSAFWPGRTVSEFAVIAEAVPQYSRTPAESNRRPDIVPPHRPISAPPKPARPPARLDVPGLRTDSVAPPQQLIVLCVVSPMLHISRITAAQPRADSASSPDFSSPYLTIGLSSKYVSARSHCRTDCPQTGRIHDTVWYAAQRRVHQRRGETRLRGLYQ